MGSAPEPILPSPESNDTVFCVNGGISSVNDRQVDVWLVNSRRTDCGSFVRWNDVRRRLNSLMIQQASGRHVGVVLLNEKSDGAYVHTVQLLEGIGCIYDHAVVVPREARPFVERGSGARIPSDEDIPVSAGVWASCLALFNGASEVVYCGFSLASGYNYTGPISWDTRGHVAADRRAITNLISRYPGRLSTTSKEFAATGLRLENRNHTRQENIGRFSKKGP